MKILSDILKDVAVVKIIGSETIAVKAIQVDSRKIESDDCFIAVKGTAVDGHDFITACVVKGATVIVCENLPKEVNENVTYVVVKDASNALGKIASSFFDNPSKQMKVVGITGTNGKTSVVTLLFRLFKSFGKNVGLLSTVQNQINEEIIPSTHTTPDAISLSKLMRQMADAGCEYCFMEVSSHAVDQNRISGISFAGAVFTNITHDHLDYHKTFDNYLRAKKKFFDELASDAFALTNNDDRNGSIMLQNTKAKKQTFALRTPADFKGKIIENTVAGLQLEIDNTELHTRLIGEFNAYNLLAVYGVAKLLGVEKMECLTALSALTPPDGRFDQVISVKGKIVGIVDYAHTPDALKNVLQTINTIRNGNESVIAVVGCGGDRDASKRPVMAEVAAHLSSKCILTSDNPRSEDANEILQQMFAGVNVAERKKVVTIADRKEAIRTACMLAEKEDIILVAGKGHEKYQEIKGVKYPFDDKAMLLEIFEELGK